MKKYLWLVLAVLTCAVMAAPIDDFKERFQNTEDSAIRSQLIQEYLPQIQDVDTHRTFQGYWAFLDQEAMEVHYDMLAKKEPNNPDYQYLALRIKAGDRLSEVRQLIKKFPNYYWNYRMFAVNLSEALNKEELSGSLKSDFKGDQKLLEQAVKKFPDDDYLKFALFNLQLAQSRKSMANQYLGEIKDTDLITSNWKNIYPYIVEEKDDALIKTLLPLYVQNYIERGVIAPEDYEDFYQRVYFGYLGETKNLSEISKLLKEKPELKDKPDILSQVAKTYVALERFEQALDILESGLERDILDLQFLTFRDPFEELYNQKRWGGLLKKAETAWDKGTDKRRTETLENRLSKKAPLWELEDAAGNTVRLEDLRGQVVILDFWATWCGPCRMALPELNQWLKEEMPAGVRLFSVNIFEKNPEDATQYFTEQGFAITLLLGNNDVAKDYGVQGIPYIVAIDKAGNLAYEQGGYSPTLRETLGFWAEALTKE